MKKSNMKSRMMFLSFIISLLLLCGCKGCITPPPPPSPLPTQLNISILLDLSDRISPTVNPCNPSHFERDTAIINFVVDYFKKDMEKLGLFQAKGKMKLFCYPYPNDPKINDIIKELNIDCSDMKDTKKKREIYKTIKSKFNEGLSTIYQQSINQENMDGSDIWRFFKNDVKDYCIDKDTTYRNILIILTDGYIYYAKSNEQINNRFQYLLSKNIKKYRGADAIKNINKDDFGLISERNDLNELEVLVLEVSPEVNHPNDEYILKHCIDKWLKEMNVKRYEIHKTDLPINTSKRVKSFIEYKH